MGSPYSDSVQNSNQECLYILNTKLVNQVFTLGNLKVTCGEIYKELRATHSERHMGRTEATN